MSFSLTRRDKATMLCAIVNATENVESLIDCHTDSLTGKVMSDYAIYVRGWKGDLRRFATLAKRIRASMTP